MGLRRAIDPCGAGARCARWLEVRITQALRGPERSRGDSRRAARTLPMSTGVIRVHSGNEEMRLPLVRDIGEIEALHLWFCDTPAALPPREAEP